MINMTSIESRVLSRILSLGGGGGEEEGGRGEGEGLGTRPARQTTPLKVTQPVGHIYSAR